MKRKGLYDIKYVNRTNQLELATTLNTVKTIRQKLNWLDCVTETYERRDCLEMRFSTEKEEKDQSDDTTLKTDESVELQGRRN